MTGFYASQFILPFPDVQNYVYAYTVVLVSAGIELILFLVAGTVLCFGFSVRIMLITR